MKKVKEETTIDEILEVSQGHIRLCVVGTTGYICNRLSEKARHELLLGGRKKNAAERATTVKHNPIAEYRSSPYINADDSAPTLLQIPTASFKKAALTAALDLPNTKRTQVGRLMWVKGQYTPIYGIPQIVVSPVRSADMNRTPDIRSRAILPAWAARLDIVFVKPLITQQAIIRLLAAAGMFIGVGDWRNEKASGSFGAFRLVEENDAEFVTLINNGTRLAQEEAMRAPEAYDEETSEILAWCDGEIARRRSAGVGAVPTIESVQ